MEQCGLKLLDEAMESDDGGGIVLITDCVETNGALLLHQIIKRSLSLPLSTVIFVSFAHPFSHYDRILRKLLSNTAEVEVPEKVPVEVTRAQYDPSKVSELSSHGCNLVVQRDNKRFVYLDMLSVECPGGFVELYGKIQGAVEDYTYSGANQNVTIMIDDVSLMEVAANGSSSHVLDFLRYCHSLATEFGCSLVLLHHGDVYSSTEMPSLSLQIEYLVDVILKAEPLATGVASDVHGQLTMVDKNFDERDNKMQTFHFRVRENCVEYFYPGSRM